MRWTLFCTTLMWMLCVMGCMSTVEEGIVRETVSRPTVTAESTLLPTSTPIPMQGVTPTAETVPGLYLTKAAKPPTNCVVERDISVFGRENDVWFGEARPGSRLCIVWNDQHDWDADSYKVVINYSNNPDAPEQIEYHVDKSETTVVIAEEDAPQADCWRRSSFNFLVYAVVDEKESAIGGIGMNHACNPLDQSVDGYPPTAMLSPNGGWVAEAYAKSGENDSEEDARPMTVFIRGGMENERIVIVDEMRRGAMIPVLIGWSADSRYLFYADYLHQPNCIDEPLFSNVIRYDVETEETITIEAAGLNDVVLSPNGKQLAVVGMSGEAEAAVTVYGVENLEATAVPFKGVSHNAGHRLHWSDESDHLILQIVEGCREGKDETAYYSVETEPRQLDARIKVVYRHGNKRLRVDTVRDGVLTLIDDPPTSAGCLFDIMIESGEIETNCSTRVVSNEIDMTLGHKLSSPDGQWMATSFSQMSIGISSDPQFVYVAVQNGATDEINVPYEAFRRITEVGQPPTLIGWSADSRYLFYAEIGNYDACGHPLFHKNITRYDVIEQKSEPFPAADSRVTDAYLYDGSTLLLLRGYDKMEAEFYNVDQDQVGLSSNSVSFDTEFSVQAVRGRLHISENGDAVVEIFEMRCSGFQGRSVYYLVNVNQPNDRDLIFSSDWIVPYDENEPYVSFLVAGLIDGKLIIAEEYPTNCGYTITLATKEIKTECEDRLAIADE